MPLQPPLDDEGREIDPEAYRALVERDYRARERDDLRVERYISPENPELVAFRVIDSAGKVRGFIGFEYEAMEKELPLRTLQRVQRAADISPRPSLKLVG